MSLTKFVKDLYTEKYKTLLKEIGPLALLPCHLAPWTHDQLTHYWQICPGLTCATSGSSSVIAMKKVV